MNKKEGVPAHPKPKTSKRFIPPVLIYTLTCRPEKFMTWAAQISKNDSTPYAFAWELLRRMNRDLTECCQDMQMQAGFGSSSKRCRLSTPESVVEG